MNRSFNQHLDNEQLMDAYYGEPAASEHLSACEQCREQFERLREMLDAFREFPIPAREPGYGSAVWTRLLPQLPDERPRWKVFFRWWTLIPTVAALLVAAFLAGRLTERGAPGEIREKSREQALLMSPDDRLEQGQITQKSRERVLLMSLSDHLEQAQVVLAHVANASSDASGWGYERDRAHELLGANRLLRQTALRLGDVTDASLLEELERVLLSVANSTDRLARADLERAQYQIEREGLLFRVRVTSAASRERGEKL